MIYQLREVFALGRIVIALERDGRAPLTARVEADDLVSLGEMRDLVIEHFGRKGPPGDEHKWRPLSTHFVVKLHARLGFEE